MGADAIAKALAAARLAGVRAGIEAAAEVARKKAKYLRAECKDDYGESGEWIAEKIAKLDPARVAAEGA